MILDELDESNRACGFCAQPVRETFKFSDAVLDFLEIYLDVKGASLPTRVCKDCFSSTRDAKQFHDKILRSFGKLKDFAVSSSFIWGRSKEDRAYLKRKFDGIGGPVSNGKATKAKKENYAPALSYDPAEYKLMLPKISIEKGEKDLANTYEPVYTEPEPVSKSGRVIKKPTSYEDDWGGDDGGDWNYNVKEEPRYVEPKPPQKTEEEWDAELSDCGETFPAKGPYQCEICQNITKMKKHFVAHIKDNHMSMIDSKVLKTLEADLVKRKKKVCEKMGKKYVNPKRKTPAKPKPKKKKPKDSDKSDTDDGDDDDEFTPAKKKAKKASAVKPKSTMKKRYEDEDKEDPGDYDQDYSGGEGGGPTEVDDAIQQAVKASLETAAKELTTSGQENGAAADQMPDTYIDPAPQPDVATTSQNGTEWGAKQCVEETVEETVVTTDLPVRPWNSLETPNHESMAMEAENNVAASTLANFNQGGAPVLYSNFGFFQPH